ncbi:hypothetical protein [Dulcicalothrix desertica]|nr:hypothetical protein [Dulcicalothrix desertica]
MIVRSGSQSILLDRCSGVACRNSFKPRRRFSYCQKLSSHRLETRNL